MLKKAMIMAAGVGSRLEPLSSVVPKPLVPLANVPTMDILVKHLASFGINNIVANTFHKAEAIQEHYKKNNFGVNFEFIKEVELSGTAGGVKKCQFFFDEGQDFIIMSGDGLTDLDITKAYESHKNSGSIATIVIKEIERKETFKYGIVVPDEKGYVSSFQEKPAVEEAKSNLANTGIYIFNYKIFDFIPANTFYDFAKNVFPSILESGLKINTFVHKGYWSDIGSLDQYHQSNIDLLNHTINSYKPVVVRTLNGQYTKGENVIFADGVCIKEDCIIGNNCKIGKNTIIKNSIIWDNVEIADNLTIENAIILSNTKIENSIRNQIISEDKLKEHLITV